MTDSVRSGSWKLPLTLGFILGGILLTFAFQNSEEVVIKFLMWEASAPLSLTYFLVVAISVIVAFLFSIPNKLKRRRLEKEVKNLKEQNTVYPAEQEKDFIEENK